MKVANILADAAKTAAETDAERDLAVATINLEVAQLDAKRAQILGKAAADVIRDEERRRGARRQIAGRSPRLAAGVQPVHFRQEFRADGTALIFAGPGTFWTDLKSFQEIGAAKMVQPKAAPTTAEAPAK